MTEPGEPLLVPHLEPRRITIDEYQAHTPEKLELIEGFLLYDQDERRRLLALLLVNVGLLEAVRAALWDTGPRGRQPVDLPLTSCA